MSQFSAKRMLVCEVPRAFTRNGPEETARHRAHRQRSDPKVMRQRYAAEDNAEVVDDRPQRRHQEHPVRRQHRRHDSADIEEQLRRQQNARQIDAKPVLLRRKVRRNRRDNLRREKLGSHDPDHQHCRHDADDRRKSPVRLLLFLVRQVSRVDCDERDARRPARENVVEEVRNGERRYISVRRVPRTKRIRDVRVAQVADDPRQHHRAHQQQRGRVRRVLVRRTQHPQRALHQARLVRGGHLGRFYRSQSDSQVLSRVVGACSIDHPIMRSSDHLMIKTAYLSLGSNLGNREANLREAVAQLAKLGEVIAVSSFYETEPVEVTDQPWFLNIAVELQTELMPRQLLSALLKIERDMGRRRLKPKGPRLIDIDILLFGSTVMNGANLVIPHPAMHERNFVLKPLTEIAPGAKHPALKKSVKNLLEDLPQPAPVVRKLASCSAGDLAGCRAGSLPALF